MQLITGMAVVNRRVQRHCSRNDTFGIIAGIARYQAAKSFTCHGLCMYVR